MSLETTEDKINKALGIENGESIEDMLESFDEEFNAIESSMKNAVEKVDTSLQKKDDIHDLKSSLGELSELIITSKNMLANVYDYVSRSEIMDPDVIRSGADLIKASNELIREYLEIYKEKIRHFNSIEMEMIKLENKKKFEQYKHELKNGGNTTSEVETVEYTQEALVKAMTEFSKK